MHTAGTSGFEADNQRMPQSTVLKAAEHLHQLSTLQTTSLQANILRKGSSGLFNDKKSCRLSCLHHEQTSKKQSSRVSEYAMQTDPAFS